MQINFAKTKARMSEVRLNVWANARGHNPVIVYRLLDGNYPWENGPARKAIIDDLRKEGFLVEEDEGEAAA